MSCIRIWAFLGSDIVRVWQKRINHMVPCAFLAGFALTDDTLYDSPPKNQPKYGTKKNVIGRLSFGLRLNDATHMGDMDESNPKATEFPAARCARRFSFQFT